MSKSIQKLRNTLSADGIFKIIYSFFTKVPDHRANNWEISLSDGLMSAFAMFSIKDASLLAFNNRTESQLNLMSIYKIDKMPSDTNMRVMLDPIAPELIKPLFTSLFRHLQRGKGLERFVFMEDHYLVSIDGTGYFSSTRVHCERCMEKKDKAGNITYYHQMLAAAIVHPDRKEVIALAPEPIVKQDGQTKNDCERNAAKRLLKVIRSDHPKLKMIVIEDALYANAPHLKELNRYNMRYIIGVKSGDHRHLFDNVAKLSAAGQTTNFEVAEGKYTHRFKFVNQISLNATNPDCFVNFLEYWQINTTTGAITVHFTWITDFEITRQNAYGLMRGGRSRWKIENETFNTIKNQGYHFEHNFGHGQQNLSDNFALLMLLAFLTDQIQQICCGLFGATWKKEGSKKQLWESMRSLFKCFLFDSMAELYQTLYYGHHMAKPVILKDSS